MKFHISTTIRLRLVPSVLQRFCKSLLRKEEGLAGRRTIHWKAFSITEGHITWAIPVFEQS